MYGLTFEAFRWRPRRGLLVAGEKAAVVALGHSGGPEDGNAFLLTREPGLISSFRAFFDVAWEAAEPLEEASRAPLTSTA